MCSFTFAVLTTYFSVGGERWRSGRASDSESRGPGFDLN